eukprot:764631-Hanusia_phi.AAC.1
MKVSKLKHMLKHRISRPTLLHPGRDVPSDDASSGQNAEESRTSLGSARQTAQRFLGDDLYIRHEPAVEVDSKEEMSGAVRPTQSGRQEDNNRFKEASN